MEDLFVSKPKADGFSALLVQDTVDAMKKHKQHNGVQFDGFQRLLQLAKHSYNAESIFKCGGLAEVVSSLQLYPYDDKLVSIGLALIGTIFLQVQPTIFLQSVWKQTISTVFVLLKSHSARESVQGIGMFCLSAFANHPCLLEFLFENNVMSLIDRATRNFVSSEFVQENAALTLLRLMENTKVDDERLQISNFQQIFKIAKTNFPCNTTILIVEEKLFPKVEEELVEEPVEETNNNDNNNNNNQDTSSTSLPPSSPSLFVSNLDVSIEFYPRTISDALFVDIAPLLANITAEVPSLTLTQDTVSTSLVWIGSLDQQPIAMALVDDSTRFLTLIYVVPSARTHNVGRTLLASVESELRRREIEQIFSLPHRWFEKHGFEPVSDEKWKKTLIEQKTVVELDDDDLNEEFF